MSKRLKYPICAECPYKTTCCPDNEDEMVAGPPCAAAMELGRIYDEADNKAKTKMVMNLARLLGRRNAERDAEMEQLAARVLKAYPELIANRARIAYVLSHENPPGEKIKYGECRKTDEVEKAFLPFDFIITFYWVNTRRMNVNQLKLLMKHELQHVGMNMRGHWKIVPHDIEDFYNILHQYGLTWNAPDNRSATPDILAGLERGTHGKGRRKGKKTVHRKGSGKA